MAIPKLTASQEDYLEAILELQNKNKVARVKEIAKHLSFSNASVTGAVKNLSEMGLVNYAPYGYITLTDDGMLIGKDVLRRHEALRDFLIQTLSIDPELADKTACKMEHVISEEITNRVIAFSAFLQKCPEASDKWLKGFQRFYKEGPDAKFDACDDCAAPCIVDYAEKKNLKS